jgi:uncharacterized protein (TIGR03435 family)
MSVLLPAALLATQDSRLSFEVASIKPSNSGVPGFSQFLPGGKYRGTKLTLKSVVAVAYDVLQKQIAGGPSWIETDRYDINAQADAGLGIESNRAGVDKTKQMLRSLLSDRFKLTVHTEMREEPIYALTIAKGGPKLVKAAREEKVCQDLLTTLSCHVFIGGQGRGLDGRTVTISEVAGALATWVDRPVLDRTAIQGEFDIHIDPWLPILQVAAAPDREDAVRDPSRPSLFALLEEQLGLKLEATKGPVEFLVIDRAEKPQLEN